MHDGLHEHPHPHSHRDELSEITAMLSYMLEHNRHHAEELREMAHKLEHHDLGAVAAALLAGAGEFDSGNDKLQKALEMLK